MRIATAFVELRTESARAKADAKAAVREMTKGAGNVDVPVKIDEKSKRKAVADSKSLAQEMSKTFAQWFTAAAFVKGVNESIQAASRLEQAVGGTEAVFKSSSKVIDQFARTSADAFGISERAARELTSQIGSLLKGFGFTEPEAAKMSVTLAKLGADLAALHGGRPEEAVQALGAALRGEFDPLERFGVSLNVTQANLKAVELGLADSTSKVDLNARAQAALAIIMERSADAQGQFAREAGSAAGQTAIATAKAEDAAADFGSALLPVYTRVVDLLGDVADGFAALPAPMQTGLVALAGFVALAGPVSSAAESVRSLVKRLGELSTASKIGAGSLIGVAVAIGVAYVAYQSLTAKQREVNTRAREVADSLDAATAAALRNADANSGAAAANQALSTALAGSGADGDKLTKALGELGLTTDEALSTLVSIGRDAKGTLTDLGQRAGLTAEQAEFLATAVADTRAAAEGKWDWKWDPDDISAITAVVRDVAGQFGLSADEAEALARAMEELQDQQEKLDLDKVIREFLATDAASGELRQQLLGQAEAQTGLKRSGDDLLPLYIAYIGLLAQNKDALIGTEGATDSVAAALTAMGDKTADAGRELAKIEDVSTDAADALAEVEQQASDLEDALDRLIGNNLDLSEAFDNITAKAWEMQESIAQNGRSLDDTTKKGQGNREFFRGWARDILETAGAMLANGASTDEAAAKVAELTESMRQQGVEAGFSEEAMAALIEEFGLTPDRVATAIELVDYDAQLRRIEALVEEIGEIPADAKTEIEALIDEGALDEAERRLNEWKTYNNRLKLYTDVITSGGTFSSRVEPVSRPQGGIDGHRAAGGPVTMGRTYLVGEEGPELFTPGQSGSITPNDTLRAAADRARNRFTVGDTSAAEYRTVLDEQLAAYEKYSNEWLSVWRELRQLDEEERRSKEELARAERDRVEAMAETGAISQADYASYLQSLMDSTEKFSPEWMAAWREMNRLRGEEQRAAQKRAEDEQQAHLDRLAKQFTAAERALALESAQRDVADATAEFERANYEAFVTGQDRNATDDDRRRTADTAERARRRLADELVEGAKARARANGFEDNTVAFARFVRAEISGAASGAYFYVGDLLQQALVGIPDLASGGIVRPRPGGTLVRAGEAGEHEAVIPLSRLHELVAAHAAGGGSDAIGITRAAQPAAPLVGSLTVGDRRDLPDTIDALDRIAWQYRMRQL